MKTISGNPRKALPKGVRVSNTRHHGAFVLTRDGIHPTNPDSASTPLEKGGVVYTRQGAKQNLQLGGLKIALPPKTIASAKQPPSRLTPSAPPPPQERFVPPTLTPPQERFVPSAPTPPQERFVPSAPTPPQERFVPPAPTPRGSDASSGTTTEPPVVSSPSLSPSYAEPEYEAYGSEASSAGGSSRPPLRQRPSDFTEEAAEEAAAAVAPMSTTQKVLIGGALTIATGLGVYWLKTR